MFISPHILLRETTKKKRIPIWAPSFKIISDNVNYLADLKVEVGLTGTSTTVETSPHL